MATYIALMTIQMQHPDGSREFTGRYADNGDAILRPKSLIVKAGDTFEIDDAEIIARLAKQGAICTPDEAEEDRARCQRKRQKSIAAWSYSDEPEHQHFGREG